MHNPVILSAPSAGVAETHAEALRSLGLEPQFHTLGAVQSPNFDAAHFGIIVVADSIAPARNETKRWRAETASRYFPIVWLLERDSAEATQAAYHSGADHCVHGVANLSPVLPAVNRVRELTEQWQVKSDEVRLLAERVQRNREQLERDVMLAKQLESTGPVDVPSGIGVVQTASQLGGDSLQCIPLGDDLLIVVSDTVAMPGCGSSLVSRFVRELVLREAIRGKLPGGILATVNDALVALNLTEPPMVSLAVVRYSATTGHFAFARGGLPVPLIRTHSGVREAGSAPGPYLGLSKADYPTQTGTLNVGEVLLLASDGVTGFANFAEAVPSTHVTNPQSFVDAMSRQLLATTDGTLVALRHPTPPETAP
jgi:hypothetical protein